MSRPVAVVVGCRWLDRSSELAFVVRSIAGAASRSGPVAVLVPGVPDGGTADGAFDLTPLGPPGRLHWPDAVPTDATIIVDELTPDLAAVLDRGEPAAVSFLAATGVTPRAEWHRLRPVGGDDPLDVHVPVNRLAERHRHHGFGFTGYVLVLGDRRGGHGEPPPAAAWVSAAFNEAEVAHLQRTLDGPGDPAS